MKNIVQKTTRALAGILCACALASSVYAAPSASVPARLGAHCDIVVTAFPYAYGYVVTEYDAYGYGIADRVTVYPDASAAQSYIWNLYTEFNICNP